MKTDKKILILFLLLIILTITRTVWTYQLQRDVRDDTVQIRDTRYPLEILASKQFLYSVMMTEEVQGALLHAQRGEEIDVKEHEDKYNAIIEQKEDVDKEIRDILNRATIPSFIKSDILEQLEIINNASPEIIEIEKEGFYLINEKRLSEANEKLVGGKHKELKEKIMLAESELAKIQHELTINSGDGILKSSEYTYFMNIIISIIGILILILSMLIMRSFIIEQARKKKSR